MEIRYVEKEDKYGLYTTSGLYITPIYNEVKADEAGFLLVRKENEWGYISEQGNFIHEKDEETLDHITILALFPEW